MPFSSGTRYEDNEDKFEDNRRDLCLRTPAGGRSCLFRHEQRSTRSSTCYSSRAPRQRVSLAESFQRICESCQEVHESKRKMLPSTGASLRQLSVTQWGCPQPARVTPAGANGLFTFCREADHLARRPDALLHDIPRCWLQASGRSTAIGATGQLQCSVAELRLPQAAASGWDGRRPEPCGRAAGGAANSGGWQGRRPLARRPNGPAPIFRSGTAGPLSRR